MLKEAVVHCLKASKGVRRLESKPSICRSSADWHCDKAEDGKDYDNLKFHFVPSNETCRTDTVHVRKEDRADYSWRGALSRTGLLNVRLPPDHENRQGIPVCTL